MNCNISKNNRIFRIIVGVIGGALGIYYQSWWGLLALASLITGIVGFCGAYVVIDKLTGMKSTCSVPNKTTQ